MKDLVIDSLLSVRNKMNPNQRKQVFELFGFDFLIDEDLRIWLIEINTNPYLGTPSKDMQVLVPKMINDMLAIVLDPYFCQSSTIDTLDPTANCTDNDFELIYREKTGNLPAVNQRRSFELDLCYPVLALKPHIGKQD